MSGVNAEGDPYRVEPVARDEGGQLCSEEPPATGSRYYSNSLWCSTEASLFNISHPAIIVVVLVSTSNREAWPIRAGPRRKVRLRVGRVVLRTRSPAPPRIVPGPRGRDWAIEISHR